MYEIAKILCVHTTYTQDFCNFIHFLFLSGLDNLVLKYIVKDMRPLSTVDSPYFTQLLQGFDPRYKLQGATAFTSKMVKLYDVKASELKSELRRQEMVSTTCDFWTSGACQSYLTVTAHYIDDEYLLKSQVLMTS